MHENFDIRNTLRNDPHARAEHLVNAAMTFPQYNLALFDLLLGIATELIGKGIPNWHLIVGDSILSDVLRPKC